MVSVLLKSVLLMFLILLDFLFIMLVLVVILIKVFDVLKRLMMKNVRMIMIIWNELILLRCVIVWLKIGWMFGILLIILVGRGIILKIILIVVVMNMF